jgi:hypothetical protein
MKKHIVCFSGGHSSALVAIYLVEKYGKENVVLVNHDIKTGMEADDIKRFKKEVAQYLGIPITYVNINGITNADDLPDQFDVCIKAGAFTSPKGNALCTALLKTLPFEAYLKNSYPLWPTMFEEWQDRIIYYGYDDNEVSRVLRRATILGAMGYKTDYPIFKKQIRIKNTKEIGIDPPNTYATFKHANCIGCLKAGLLHWYVTYCLRPDVYNKGSFTEQEMDYDYTIHRVTRSGVTMKISLEELRPIYEQLKQNGVPATEHQSDIIFGNELRKLHIEALNIAKPCECTG